MSIIKRYSSGEWAIIGLLLVFLGHARWVQIIGYGCLVLSVYLPMVGTESTR